VKVFVHLMADGTVLGVLETARLRQVRRLRELQEVLFDRDCCRKADLELPMYEIYRDCCHGEARDLLQRYGLRYDVTVVPPLLLGEEYVKTLGHYHLPVGEAGSHPELFEVLEGEAEFLVQKECGGEVADVSLIIAREGEKVLIPPDRGHVMVNASSRRLVVGNLISRSCAEMRDQFLERRGAAFYVLTWGRLVRNPRYSSVSEIRVLKAVTPPSLQGGSGLVQAFMKDPDLFAFLNEPGGRAGWGGLDHGQLPLASGNLAIFVYAFFATYAGLMFLTLVSMAFYR